jgi:Carboxypeptidase regulatory-like domain/TonB dependent receptor/TonB-dependent Receptor Plug Domain
MKQGLVRLGSLVAILLMVTTLAYGQGSVSSTLTGTVLDTSGGAIPGATVVAKNNGTGVTTEAISSSQGTFTIPALLPGTYSVTVSLTGFKTAVFNGVVLSAGVPAAIAARLEVGGITETVVVEGAAALVQTVSSAVSSTVNTKQIQSLPLTSRSVIDFVTFLPGVQTAGGNRGSAINGLPQATINITLDGVNIQDNTLRSTDGFFTIISPRLDAIEEVTVSTAAGESAGGGSGAVQIRFTTRSGTNAYSGSLYHYYRDDTWTVFGKDLHLNMNTWFNNRNGVAKPKLLQHQRGGRLGGPIVIPGLYDGRGKAFFFTNVEHFLQPSEVTRTRTVFHELARAGNYRYLGPGNVVQSVNLLTLASANGQLATMDPTISKLLADIRQATTTTGTITTNANPLHDTYNYNVAVESRRWFPTYRLDYNFTNNHRFSTILNWHSFSDFPDTLNGFDPSFPGFPVFGSQSSKRRSSSNSLRSTFGQNVVNEARVAFQGSPVEFFNEQFDPGIWNQAFGGQGGFHLTLGSGLTNAGPAPNAQSRNVDTWRIENTVSWLKGSHSLSFGASFDRANSWNKFRATVPTVQFGMLPTDPAIGMFTTANFPGASAAQLTAAQNMYALLTGRVSSLAGTARVDASTGKYVFSGLGLEESRLDEYGVFAQDSWRVRSNLSVNIGVRWDVQAPFRALNNSYATATLESVWGRSGYAAGCDVSNATPETCNLFKPGQMPGSPTVYEQWKAGTKAYNVDWNNVAPSIGFNWTPDRLDGFLGALMGASGDFAIRGGFARSFQRPAMGDLRARFSTNPGLALAVAKNQSLGNLGANPLLFRDTANMTPAAFSDTPVFPNSGLVTNSVNAFDPNLQVPYADTWTLGLQRGITKNMAGEVRYVGTRARQQWTNYDFNELNIIENGVLNEFKLAQANLQANVAAGQAAQGFRYRGPGTGTSPLPIFLAYFSGVSSANAGNAALYSSTLFTNATFLNPLSRHNPNPFTFGNALDNDATRRANALAAGLPANFLRANPDKLGGAVVGGYGDFTNFNSLQFELRRRLANGVQFNASYVWGVGEQSIRYSFRVPRQTAKRTGTAGGAEVTHAFKLNWMLELPFGRGKRFMTDAGSILDRVIGGWQLHGNVRVQSGAWVEFGNVNMVGFDKKELQKMFKLRINENQRVFMLPQDVIDETIKAFSTSPTSVTGYGALGAPSGKYFAPAMGANCLETISANYGDCGTRELSVRGPAFKEVDISIMKLLPIVKRVTAEFRIEMLNAFNSVNYVPVTGVGNTTAAGFEVGGLTGTNTARVVQLVSRISW